MGCVYLQQMIISMVNRSRPHGSGVESGEHSYLATTRNMA